MPEQVDIHHQEVQEIMGRMPGWVTRWASVGLLGCFFLLIYVAHLLRIPDQVQAQVLVTSTSGSTLNYHVQVYVPISQVAAIKPGQPVFIELDAYPARQYGYVVARVGKVMPFRNADFVELQVSLPFPWLTSTGYTIELQPVLKGRATVTVSESTLLHRIWRY